MKRKLSTKIGRAIEWRKVLFNLNGQVFFLLPPLPAYGKRCVLTTGCSDWKNSFMFTSQHERTLQFFVPSSNNGSNVLRYHVQRSNALKLKTKHRFLMLKSLSEITRWFARANVLRAEVTSRNEIKNTFEDLIDDNT
ncbi:uncharacterized protein TNCV_238441 [Trichonephila clavipes]|nr:uncharacterized protein TNCV_238441 [Trichonephila clavipes]